MEYTFSDIRESNMKNKQFILVDEHNKIVKVTETQIKFYRDKMNYNARLYALSIIMLIIFRYMY